MNLVHSGPAAGDCDDGQPAVIEIDVSGPWSPPDAVAPVHPTWWLAAVLTPLLVLGLAAGGERAAPLAPVVQLSIPAQRGAVIDHVLYATDAASAAIRAYDLPGGRLLWQRRPRDGETLDWQAHGDIIVISTVGDDGTGRAIPDAGGRSIEVLDGTTRRPLWHRGSAAVIGAAGDVVVVRQFAADAAGSASTLVGVDRRSGGEIWSISTAPGAATFAVAAPPAGDSSVLIVADPDGTVHGYDLASGAETEITGAGGGIAGSPAIACNVYVSGAEAGQSGFRTVCLPSDLTASMVDPSDVRWSASGRIGRLAAGIVATDRDGAAVGNGPEPGIRVPPGWTEVGTADDGRMLVLAQATTERGRGLLAGIDRASGGMQILGRLPAAMGLPSCGGTGAAYLLCTDGTRLGVWRLPARR